MGIKLIGGFILSPFGHVSIITPLWFGIPPSHLNKKWLRVGHTHLFPEAST